MRIEFTFSRDADYFREGLLPGARLRTRSLRNAAWLVIVAGAALTTAYHEKAAGPVLGAGLVLAGIVALLVRRRWITSMITVPVSWHSPRRWLVTEDGLESSTELSSATYAWSAFRLALARADAYVLFRGQVAVDIPRRPLTAEQDEELNAFLRERGLLGLAARR